MHDPEQLLAAAADPSSGSRADDISRLWGSAETLSSSQRDRLAGICRSALSDPDPAVRGQAVLGLGQLGNAEDLDRIEAALADPEWFPRLSAASALNWQKPPTGIGALERLRDDPNRLVREQVREILAGHGAPRGASASGHRSHAAAGAGYPAAKSTKPGWLRAELRHFLRDLPKTLGIELGMTVLIALTLYGAGYSPAGNFVVVTLWGWVAMAPLVWVFTLRQSIWTELGRRGWASFGLASVWALCVFVVMNAVLGP